MEQRITRRTFLGSAAVGTAVVVARPLMARSQAGTAPFLHGVASGDPLADRVILWTRVTPTADALPGSGVGPPVDVQWEVARDQAFTSVVARGQVTATAASDHTVKVDAAGLKPGADHWYRFMALGATSPVGRTRTAPAAGAALDALRIGVVTCAEYEFGYFGAYRHLAARDDVDVVIHLGDYIYEFGVGYGHEPTVLETPGPAIGRTHEPPAEIVSLADYRTRYAQYRRDADCQALHAAHPVIPAWDDHEFANDAWNAGAENHQPEEGDYAARAAGARQAWREWHPVRQDSDGVTYRSFRFGDLAEMWMLDERRYRSQQPANAFISYGSVDPAINDPSRTMLGAAQHEWLVAGLTGTSATWKLLGNPVMFMPFVMGEPLFAALTEALGPALPVGLPLPPPLTVDDWNGYNAERVALMETLQNAPVRDVVVLTGDYHESFAADVPSAIGTYRLDQNSVAVEFIAPSVTSPGLGETLELGGLPPPGGQGVNVVFEANIAAHNQWVKYHEGFSNGFGVFEVTAEKVQFDFVYLADRMDPTTPAEVAASWQARRGDPHVEQATGPLAPRARSANQDVAPASAPPAPDLPATGVTNLPAAAIAAGAAGLALRRLRTPE